MLFSFTPSHLALFVLIITTIVPGGYTCPEGQFKETERPGPHSEDCKVTSHYHILDSSAPIIVLFWTRIIHLDQKRPYD